MFEKAVSIISYSGELFRFMMEIITGSVNIRYNEVIRESVFIIRLSRGFTAFTGCIVGAIITLQFAANSAEFNILSYLGGLSASGIIRETGPLMIAFMMVGRIGAYTTAELAAMSTTEQIDALEALGVDTTRSIVIPRFMGILHSGLILLVIALFFSLLGSYVMAIAYAGLTSAEFFRSIPVFFRISTLIMCLVKCFMFSLAIAVVSTYESRHAGEGAEGAGRAVVKSSVISMVAIIILDVLITLIFDLIMKITGSW